VQLSAVTECLLSSRRTGTELLRLISLPGFRWISMKFRKGHAYDSPGNDRLVLGNNFDADTDLKFISESDVDLSRIRTARKRLIVIKNSHTRTEFVK